LDLEAGRLLTFQGCTDGLPANVQRTGTSFTLTAQQAPGWPVSIDLPLDDQACDGSFELLTGLETRKKHDSFSWASQTDIPVTNPDELIPAPALQRLRSITHGSTFATTTTY